MRKAAIFLITGVYLLAFFQPFLPYLNYAVKKEYISEVLCVNRDTPESNCKGHCFLNRELKKAAGPTDPANPAAETRCLAPHFTPVVADFAVCAPDYSVDILFLVPADAPLAALVVPPPRA